jgi:DnaJ-class molecular chaperone
VPGEIISAVLNSPIGESLNDKLRQFLGLPPQEPSPKIKEEARGVTEKIREMRDAPYRVLGVDPDAPDELIDKIYRTKAKYYHPDVTGSDQVMVKLNQAYQEIKRMRGRK